MTREIRRKASPRDSRVYVLFVPGRTSGPNLGFSTRLRVTSVRRLSRGRVGLMARSGPNGPLLSLALLPGTVYRIARLYQCRRQRLPGLFGRP